MIYLIQFGVLAALFLAMPFLAVVFSRYCDAVNRFLVRRKPGHGAAKPGIACTAYRLPTTATDSGLCARCGMSDYKHKEQP